MRRKGHSKPVAPSMPTPTLTQEEELELDFYVCCSIEEIENILLKNSSEKQKKLAEISLKILRNPAETFIRKKQVMRQLFDDYKKKFESKKKQTVINLNENKCTFKEVDIPKKSVFFRKHEVKNSVPVEFNSESSDNFSLKNEEKKCVIKTSDNSFKFDF